MAAIQAFNANLKLLGPDLEAWGPDQRNLALRMCVHCADIANPAKPLPLALQWTQRVVTEFFNQVCFQPLDQVEPWLQLHHLSLIMLSSVSEVIGDDAKLLLWRHTGGC